MNDYMKSGIYVGVASLLAATAIFGGLASRRTPAEHDDRGAPFFPSFTEPAQAKALEVSEFDSETGAPLDFAVAFKKGRWVIPSHDEYPADARDRLGRTASGIVGLRKDTIRSDRPEDHKGMGVLDPSDPKVTSPEGLGKRITLKDENGAEIANLIVGKPVPGQQGQRFVRLPGKNRVYGVQLDNVELSTRFADWIETNLLGLDSQKIESITFDTHKVDITRGELRVGDVIEVKRAAPAAGSPAPGAPRWTMTNIPAGQEVNSQALDTLGLTLADLKIVGVRPKPPGLTEELKAAGGTQTFDALAMRSLASKGFYLLDGRLLSSEGAVYVACSDGIRYTLRFGQVTFARGQALSAGLGDDSEQADAASKESEGTPESAVESRYLFVTAKFDPALIPKPAVPADGELPANVFARSVAEEAQEAARLKADQAAYEKKIEEGTKRAQTLTDKFAGWYFVVPGDAFRKVSLDRSQLLKPIGTATPPPGGGPVSFPGMPGGPGQSPFPPGFPGRT